MMITSSIARWVRLESSQVPKGIKHPSNMSRMTTTILHVSVLSGTVFIEIIQNVTPAAATLLMTVPQTQIVTLLPLINTPQELRLREPQFTQFLILYYTTCVYHGDEVHAKADVMKTIITTVDSECREERV